MAEEFNKILKSIKGKSLEEKINVVLETVKNVTEIVLKLHDNININLNAINQRINTLELRINNIDGQLLQRKQPKQQQTALPPPPSPEKISYHGVETKSAIMGELKTLFEKRKNVDKK